jgi:hypothetical protein
MISLKHKFIFIDIPKTASTSLRTALYDETCKYIHSCLLNKTVTGFVQYDSMNRNGSVIDPDEIDLNDYFVFTVVRNPFDRLVSYYRWRISKYDKPGSGRKYSLNPDISFDEYVENIEIYDDQELVDHSRWHKPQIDWISYDEGSVCTDYIGRFESLSESWNHIKTQINVDGDLQHLMKNDNSVWYQDFYNSHTKQLVRERYKRDLDFFNYDF